MLDLVATVILTFGVWTRQCPPPHLTEQVAVFQCASTRCEKESNEFVKGEAQCWTGVEVRREEWTDYPERGGTFIRRLPEKERRNP